MEDVWFSQTLTVFISFIYHDILWGGRDLRAKLLLCQSKPILGFFAVLVPVAVVVAYALVCFTRPNKLSTEHAHYCLLADVLLVLQTIFTICVWVFLNFRTIRKEEVLFNKLNFILITGKLVQQFSPPLTVKS